MTFNNYNDTLENCLHVAMTEDYMDVADFDAAILWQRKIREDDMRQADWEDLEMFLIEQEMI